MNNINKTLFQTLEFNEVIVISDPHAHLKTFQSLYNKIREKHPSSPIIVLGDMIDKGKKAKELIEFIKNTSNVYALLGNHDHFMIVESRPFWKRYESLWLYNHGEMTHKSYGGKWGIKNDQDKKLKFYEHLNWIKSLPLMIELPNIKINNKRVFLSHGNAKKSISMAGSFDEIKNLLNSSDKSNLLNAHIKDATTNEQKIALELLWNVLDKNELPHYEDLFNVFGHSSQNDIIIGDSFACIDTGVYFPNKLSALHLPSMEIIEQQTIEDNWNDKGE